MSSEPLSDDQLADIGIRAAHLYEFVTLPPEADQLAGRDVPALLAEVRRLQGQRKFLVDQIAKRDAESGAGDRALAEFLRGQPDEPTP